MTTLDDIRALAERGQFEDALEQVEELEDRLNQIEALIDVAIIMKEKGIQVDWILGVIDDAEYITKHSKDPYIRAVGYGMIAFAFHVMGYYDEASEIFDRAIEEVGKIKDTLATGQALATIAYYIAITGDAETALELFNAAFDVVVRAEIEYKAKVDGLIKVAELIENAGDKLFSKNAIEFYKVAFDIFDKLHVNQRAGVVEKKLQLAEITSETGLPEIRRALLEGRYHYALALIKRKFRGASRLIGELEAALWMKRVNDPAYLDVIEEALQEASGVELSPASAERIATLLTQLGSLREALAFAQLIDDLNKKSSALKGIALALAEREEYEEAKKVAELIPLPDVREETLRDVEGMSLG